MALCLAVEQLLGQGVPLLLQAALLLQLPELQVLKRLGLGLQPLGLLQQGQPPTGAEEQSPRRRRRRGQPGLGEAPIWSKAELVH